MNKRVRKAQVIKALEREGFGQRHTLRKGWQPVNGHPRYGWHIASTEGWISLGETLQDVIDYLDWRKDEREYYRRQIAAS